MLMLLTEGAWFLVSGDSSSYLEAYKCRRLANNDNQDPKASGTSRPIANDGTRSDACIDSDVSANFRDQSWTDDWGFLTFPLKRGHLE
jgi:hypothetical protein